MNIQISGLSDVASQLLTRRIYIVMSQERDLVRQCVSDTLVACDHSALICEKQAQNYLSQRAIEQWQQNKLSVLSLEQNTLIHTPKHIKRFLNELTFYGFHNKNLIVIDPAEHLLNLSDENNSRLIIRQLKNWAFEHDCAFLFIFSKAVGQASSLNNLIATADQFAGLVHLVKENNQAVWKILHWFSHQGMQGKSSFELLQTRSGEALQTQEIKTAQNSIHEPLNGLDENLVHITQSAAFDARDLPHLWTAYNSLEDLLKSTKDVINGTIIFDYSSQTKFDTLAKQVYDLRIRLGNKFKLVVRENDASIRHYHEQLLLRLGCNLVVPSNVQFSRFVSMIQTLQGQIFTRQLNESYESIIQDVPPANDTGYLKPIDFVESVSHTLQGMRLSGVQSVLISFDIIDSITALDILSACHLSRHGDVFTASESHFYLFLFACRESDISLSLENIFDLPVAELTLNEIRYIEIQAITDAIDSLGKSIKHAKEQFSDYSGMLHTLDTQVLPQTLKEPTDSRSTRHLLFNPKPLVPAKLSPLKQRRH